ncbi:MAG: ribulose-phosphate 3-epimerase [Oscillospiraceae bacterium]|nr:ribulose-phosphate 3-epimerase [Oscillospiraceae bacterium]
MIKISPSILMADFANLGDEIKSVSSADYLHFDVMDGVFVPNISIGLPVLESVRKVTDMLLDVHLMIASPHKYTARFAQAGADIVVFHVEAEMPANISFAINELHALGKKSGLSIKPDTAVSALAPFMDLLDVVLVMAVEPGFGGQSFMNAALPKIAELRYLIDAKNLHCDIEVDGGINPDTARLCIEAGATVLVAGNDVFRAADRAARIMELRSACMM